MSTAIDITNIPDLIRIVREVETTKVLRELKLGNKIVAVLSSALSDYKDNSRAFL